MIEILDELNTASNLLNLALERYLAACSTVRSRSDSIPRALLDRVTSERLFAASYEVKIQRARVDINQAINCNSTVVPISALPSEMLTRIFHLALPSRLHECKYKFPLYPDMLSHVCSRWRQVSIGSCELWSHIDFTILPVFRREHLARAEAFAARAGQLLLHVHIIDRVIRGRAYPNPITALVPFLNSVSPRMHSLELVTKYAFREYYFPILQSCFANGVPGRFRQLIISEYSQCAVEKGVHGFIETAEGPIHSGSLPLNISRNSLEDFWLPITELQLSGLYPHWTSKIYHGLVELHLHCWQNPSVHMTESQLVGILTSSPQLRALRSNLRIEDPVVNDTPILPVRLDDLEILKLRSLPYNQLGNFLQWIAPGSKPLQLSLSLPDDAKSSPTYCLDTKVRDFFRRSNVTKLFAECDDIHPWVAELLRLSPCLQVLVLNNHVSRENPGLISYPNEHDTLAPCSYLDRLYLLRLAVEFDQLKQMIERCSVHELLVQGLKLLRGQQLVSDEELKRDLPCICPIVRILVADAPIPGKNWDLSAHSRI